MSARGRDAEQRTARGPDRAARVADLHDVAQSLPEVTRDGNDETPVYQVKGKSFLFFRTPRKDAVDEHGERLCDVVVVWVENDAAKQALLADETLPLFTTDHFNGHPSVLLQHSRVGEMSLSVLAELVQDAWLARAPKRLAKQWLADQGITGD